MKNQFCLLLCTVTILRAEIPEFKFEASYGVGIANYTEEGSIRPIESDWSAVAGDLFLEAQGRLGKTYPYLNVHLTASDTDTESWKELGVLVQENDLRMAGVDFNFGLKIPLKKSWGTLTPSLGLLAGYKSFTRDNFTFFNGETSMFGLRTEVVEDVTTYGAGGGLALDFPLGEQWLWGANTSATWLFYTYAENDGFNTGIDGGEGLNWESELWFARKLKKPGQILGMKLMADLQWITGDSTRIEGTETIVEWPDNEWEYFSLALFWRGDF